MYKTILIVLLLLICFGVIAKAEPLPLVPGATYSQSTQKADEDKKTENTKETKKEEQIKTSETTKVTQEAEEKQVVTVNGDNTNTINSIEAVHSKWFSAAPESKEQGKAEGIAAAVEQAGDYRAKANMSFIILNAGEKLKTSGEYSMDSLRSAIDALMKWDFTYGING